jgi:uncharacterized membrane protein
MKSYAISKAIIFRVVVVVIDFLILWIVFDDALNAGIGTAARHAVQVLMYWYHERVWERHPWGIVDGVETTKRSLLKTLTFRSLTFGKDLFAILFFTAELSRGLIGVAVLTIVNTVIYIAFERIWAVKENADHNREAGSVTVVK